jgi:MATE family multidrug resistance protein
MTRGDLPWLFPTSYIFLHAGSTCVPRCALQATTSVGHRGLLQLAWPILVTMISYTLLSVVNSIYVGWMGTAELAAIGLATSAIYLVQSFGLGWLGAVRVLVANRTGAGQHAEVASLTWTGLLLALLLGLLVALTVPFGPRLFSAMGASEAVLPLASGYFAWRVGSTPVVYLFTALQGALQGRGDTRTPMVANLLANAVNLVLDPLLIFGWGPFPALGIEGAAVGCVAGLLCGLLYLAWHVRDQLDSPSASLGHLRALWSVGSPMGAQFLLDVASFSVLAALLARSGDAHLAAHVVVVRIVMMSFLPCHALAEATGVLVGQNLGARQPEQARQALWLGVTQATVVMVTLGVVFLAMPGPLIGIFGAAPDVVAIATPIVMLYACMQVLDGAAAVVFGALVGAGDTGFTMRVAMAGAWLVKMPVAVACVLGLGLGAMGSWLGIGAEIVFVLAIGLLRVRGSRWLAGPSAAAELEACPAK